MKVSVRNIVEKTPAMIASLETLKCICSTCDKDLVERNIDQVLTCVMFGVSQDTEETVVTGLQALLECLDCTAANFARQDERNYLMTVICNLTQSTSDQVTSLALECLNKIVSLYYPLMEDYMAAALIPISLAALQCQQELTVMQAIEFWSTICDCEQSLSDDCLQAVLGDQTVTLVDSLHTIMTEGDNLDMDQWTQLTAATNCLSLLTESLGPAVGERSQHFVSQMINSDQWRHRHAAIIAISTLLDLEDRPALGSVITSFLSVAETFLQDDNSNIRRAASYVLMQVSDRAVDILNTYGATSSVSCLAGLCLQSPDHRMTEHGCLVISNLFRSQSKSEEKVPYIEALLHQLLSVTDPDFLTSKNQNSSLRQVAFSALSDIIEYCSHQQSETLKKSVPVLLKRFEHLLSSEASSALHIDISFNCSILNSIILSLEREVVLGLASEMLPVISKMFDHQQLHEDAILILRAMIDHLGTSTNTCRPIEIKSYLHP